MTDTPHRLGRIVVPDDRDWSVRKLHEELKAATPVPPESLLGMTIQEALTDPATGPFFTTWAGIRALWAWLKHHLPKPAPKPIPTPTDTPAWADPIVLDQGDYGTCVGNGWAGWLASDPVQDPNVTETTARAIYYEATVIDGQPDNPDAPGGGQQGSTVRSGAKAVLNRGRLAAYAFAASLAEVDEWLDNHGPVVFGTDWYDGMFNPDGLGIVKPTGSIAGGHCYLCIDRLPNLGLYEFVNSWGTGWAKAGHFFMHAADVAKLLAAQGEACCAAELPL